MENEHCVDCVPARSRITEIFIDRADMGRRTAALASLSTMAFVCVDGHGRYRICYKGMATQYGVLARYEGAPLDIP